MRARVAFVALAAQRPRDHSRQLLRNVWRQRAHVGSVARANGDQHRLVRGRRVRRLAREHLEQDGAQAEQVRTAVDVGERLRLLGRHVEGGTQHRALVRQRVDAGLLLQLGDAEVDDFDEAWLVVAAAQKYVVRLQVTVNDAGAMSGAQGLQHLHADPHRGLGVEPAFAAQARAQVFARQKLHDQERQAMLAPAGVEDLYDVRALGEARGFGLALKTRRRIAVFAGQRTQELQRHPLADGSVGGLKYGAHATASDQAIDVILACDGGPNEQIELVRRLFPTSERHASSGCGAQRARHNRRLASFTQAFQALADFASAFAMREVVRAAVRG